MDDLFGNLSMPILIGKIIISFTIGLASFILLFPGDREFIQKTADFMGPLIMCFIGSMVLSIPYILNTYLPRLTKYFKKEEKKSEP